VTGREANRPQWDSSADQRRQQPGTCPQETAQSPQWAGGVKPEALLGPGDASQSPPPPPCYHPADDVLGWHRSVRTIQVVALGYDSAAGGDYPVHDRLPAVVPKNDDVPDPDVRGRNLLDSRQAPRPQARPHAVAAHEHPDHRTTS
jgi:hypothetical protein